VKRHAFNKVELLEGIDSQPTQIDWKQQAIEIGISESVFDCWRQVPTARNVTPLFFDQLTDLQERLP
jgi:hypothetical protein